MLSKFLLLMALAAPFLPPQASGSGAPPMQTRDPSPLDEFVELECDTVIYALGTKANPIVTQATPGLGLNKWGYIIADPTTQATTGLPQAMSCS